MNGRLSSLISSCLVVVISVLLTFVALMAIPNLPFTFNLAPLFLPSPGLTAPATTPAIQPTISIKCPNGDCANACLSKLTAIREGSTTSEAKPRAGGQGTNGVPATVLVTYPVSGDKLGSPEFAAHIAPNLTGLQHDTATQQKIWEYFTTIIPADQRSELDLFVIATDGPGGMLASVEQFSGHSDIWGLVVDSADAGKPRDLTFTLLHEFGHLLTLNSSQVAPDEVVLEHPDDQQVFQQQATLCPRYFASGGCSLPDSYINQFFNQFWTKLYGEWSTVNAARHESNYVGLLSAFYREHSSQFITPYAATSPEEDMAETFSHFVLMPKPADDTIAHKKVLFFYDFPELVSLRNEIISGICTYASNQ